MRFEYETKRLKLKILNEQYAKKVTEFLYNNRNRFEIFEPAKLGNYYTIQTQEAILKVEMKLFMRLSSIRYYLFDKYSKSGKIIGTVSITGVKPSPENSARTGYRIDAEYEGKGYASEALNCIIYHAFKELPLERIEAFILPENTRSSALAKRIGFTYEGVARSFCQINGTRKDHLIFSLLKEEFLSKIQNDEQRFNF